MNIWPSWKEQRPFAVLLSLLLVLLVVFVGVKVDHTLRASEQIGKPEPFEHTIFVEGEGRVNGKPDIASLVLSVESKADTVAEAQTKNTETMNTIIDEIKKLEIAEDDIQTTGYNVYENYVWNDKTQISENKGWVVSNQVTVKVRDTEKVSAVLAMSGQNGITNISGPNFTIDDPSNLKAEARAEALEDAEKKAKEIAASLGVKLESVVGFSEWYEQPPYPQPYYAMAEMGGGGAPTIEAGTSEVVMHVTITYKLAE